MNRLWGRAVGAAMLSAGAAVFVPACAHDDTTLFVYDVLLPPVVAVGSSCTFTGSTSQSAIPSGALDDALAPSYTAEFLLGNQLIQQADPNGPKTETSFIEVQGAVVTVKDFTGTQVLSQFTVNASQIIPPATGGTPGFSPIGITILDAATIQTYGPGTVNANPVRFLTFTHFFGVTLGGQSVTSNEYEFPVDVCYGCLVFFSQSDINTTYTPIPNCVGNGQTPPMSEPCFFGEDGSFDCSLCLSNPVCNPPAQLVSSSSSSASSTASTSTSTSASTSSSSSSAGAGVDAEVDSSTGDATTDSGSSDASASEPDAEGD